MDNENNIKRKTDEELVILAKNNDAEAIETLMERYKSVVKAVTHSLYLSGGDSEDLLQEGMVGIFKAIATYNGKTPFSTYVFTCVKNNVLSAVRKYGSNKNLPLKNYISLSGCGEGADKPEIVISDGFDPETDYINKESEKELKSNIKKILSGMEYRILTLYLQGFSYSEIGSALGKTSKTADNAIQRIRKKVIKTLGGNN